DVAIDFYSAHSSHHDKTAQRNREATAKAIARHAEELLRYLGAADNILANKLRRQLWGDPFRLPAKSFDEIIAGVQTLKAIAESEANPVEPDDSIGTTPRKLLINTLAKIYERHFNRKAGRSRRDSGEVYGPYISFVRAVFGEIGEVVSPFTIDSYLNKPK